MSTTSYSVILYNINATVAGKGTLAVDTDRSVIGFNGTANGTSIQFSDAPATITTCNAQESVVVDTSVPFNNGTLDVGLSASVSTMTVPYIKIKVSGIGGLFALVVPGQSPTPIFMGTAAGLALPVGEG